MNVRAILASTTFASLAFAPLALAADEAAHAHEKTDVLPTIEQGFVPMLISIVVFIVVLAVLSVKVWPLILSGLKEREKKIKDEIEGAELARSQAKDALEQYQQSLSQARAEAQKEIDKARAQAQIIAAELKAKADVELNAMREKAMRDIDNAKKAAVSEIYSHSTQLATTMAGKILRREVNSGDTQRLLDESVAQLSGSRN